MSWLLAGDPSRSDACRAQGQAERHDHDRGSCVDRARGRRRPRHRRGDREGLPGSALRRGEAELHPEAAEGRPARSSSAASSRSAGCRRSFSRAATRRFSRARRAISTRRCSAQILEIPTGQVTRAMGDVHPLGNPHYWLGSRERQAHRQGDRRQAVSSSGRTTAPYFAAAADRLHDAARRGREALAGADGAVQGTKVVTYHRSFPNFAERFGLDIIGYVEPQAGHSADAAAHARPDQRDEAAEREAGAGRAVLRPEDAQRDRARRPARRCS